MTKLVHDLFFVLPMDEYTLLKEYLPRHSIGYAAFDLAIAAGDGKRALTCSENELRDVIQSVEHKFPLGKALASLIRQQWEPSSESHNTTPKKSKQH